MTASRPGCGLHPWRHQAVSGPVRLEPATNQSVLKVVLTLSFFSGFSFRLFSQSLWEVQFPSRYAQVSCFQALKHHFVLFLFIFRAFCFHYIDVIKFPLPVFMSQNFFQHCSPDCLFPSGLFSCLSSHFSFVFISLGFSFALNGSCFLFIFTTDEYCISCPL